LKEKIRGTAQWVKENMDAIKKWWWQRIHLIQEAEKQEMSRMEPGSGIFCVFRPACPEARLGGRADSSLRVTDRKGEPGLWGTLARAWSAAALSENISRETGITRRTGWYDVYFGSVSGKD
jgi:hypothetical protein